MGKADERQKDTKEQTEEDDEVIELDYKDTVAADIWQRFGRVWFLG
jgi:hypothetical protein